MNRFIQNFSAIHDIQFSYSEEYMKRENSYSCDQNGNIINLYLYGVNLVNLDALLPIADKLEVLYLENCSIERITSPNSFSNLEKLSLSENPFEQSELKELVRFPRMTVLDLSMTNITDTTPLDSLINLEKIDLSFNAKLHEVKGLEKLKLLKQVNIEYSRIDNLGKINLHENLQSLYVNAGKFKRISDLEKYKNLRNLELDSNGINQIEGLEHLTKLRRLILSANSISKIEGLNSLTDLEILDVCMNEISQIEGLGNLHKLKQLNLLDNMISEVKNLDGLNNLEYILLDNNKITEFHSTFLNNLRSQCYISITDNPLKELETSIPSNVKIEFETDSKGLRFL